MSNLTQICVTDDIEVRTTETAVKFINALISVPVSKPNDYLYLFDRAVKEARDLLTDVIRSAAA